MLLVGSANAWLLVVREYECDDDICNPLRARLYTSGLTTRGTTRPFKLACGWSLHARTTRMCVLSENSGS